MGKKSQAQRVRDLVAGLQTLIDSVDLEVLQGEVEQTLSDLTDTEAEDLHTLLQNEPQLGERLLQHFEMDAMLRATKPLAVPGAPRRGTNAIGFGA